MQIFNILIIASVKFTVNGMNFPFIDTKLFYC